MSDIQKNNSEESEKSNESQFTENKIRHALEHLEFFAFERASHGGGFDISKLNS
jgi:hypothetical protein